MILFHNDYSEGCHESILQRLQQTNLEQTAVYGTDLFCAAAAERIRSLCKDASLSVHFLVGGTQTNLAVIAASLRPHQAVLGVQTAHVNVHETGAIEATGHKVVTLPSDDGKITARQIREIAYAQASDAEPEHAVQIKLVYISNPTEMGTTYSLREMEEIAQVCREFGLYLYVDGARLGYALAASDNDLQLPDLARLCDVFYIGGTKQGALFGEAVVFSNKEIAKDFRYIIKQRGGLLAKGWLLGKQFEALFENGLYINLSQYANTQAERIREALLECGYQLYVRCNTNQTFVILPNDLLEVIGKEFTYMVQETLDSNNSIVRFCTSWSTDRDGVSRLCQLIRNYKKGD